VAFVQDKTHPIYATQFHPEKNQYEFHEDYEKNDLALTSSAHWSEAQYAMAEVGRAFVDLCRELQPRFKADADLMNELAFYNFATKKQERPGTLVNYIFPSHQGEGAELEDVQKVESVSEIVYI
jgi:hypothetical protein